MRTKSNLIGGCLLFLCILSMHIFGQIPEKVTLSLGFDAEQRQKTLMLFQEKPLDQLAEKSKISSILRLFLMPCFASPECFVFEERGEQFLLVHKTLSGKGGYDWGKLATSNGSKVVLKNAKKVLDIVQRKEFWDNLSDMELFAMADVYDGDQWWIEYWDGKQYRWIILRSPRVLKDREFEKDIRSPSAYLNLESEFRALLKIQVQK
jgi:hypothetical protein